MHGDDGAESKMLFWLLKTVEQSITIYGHVWNASSYLFHHIGQQRTYPVIKKNKTKLPPLFL